MKTSMMNLPAVTAAMIAGLMRLSTVFGITTIGVANLTAQQIPTREQQIAAATLPLPEAYRAGAAVQSRSADLKITELRKATNLMVCTIVRPGAEIFAVHCFEKGYEAIVEPGTQLLRELGKNGKPADISAANAALQKEIDSGRIKLPARPSVGFQMRGPGKAFDWTTNTASGEIKRWEMIMIPNATGASLNLPANRPADGGLWVMDEGMPAAHIMVEH
jgi:hypothetical protein